MELIEILSSEVFKVPIYKGNRSVVNILNMKFDAFIGLIKKFQVTNDFNERIKNHVNDIQFLCKKLINSQRMYLQGSPYKAYLEFSDGLSDIMQAILHFSTMNRIKYPEGISFFRIRKSDNKYLSQSDIFHIPFEERGKIRNQRFSISGFPCLYLGSSIYVCWEELNRPDFENIAISKFKLLTKHPNILDLTFSIADSQRILNNFKKDNSHHEWLISNIVDKVILFPLIIACSIIDKGNTNIFKEEYVIPQLLTEWVRNGKQINAIEYHSSSLPNYNLHHSLYTNYVFPAKRSRIKGHCKYLSSIFEFTDPISWNFAKSLQLPIIKSLSSVHP